MGVSERREHGRNDGAHQGAARQRHPLCPLLGERRIVIQRICRVVFVVVVFVVLEVGVGVGVVVFFTA